MNTFFSFCLLRKNGLRATDLASSSPLPSLDQSDGQTDCTDNIRDSLDPCCWGSRSRDGHGPCALKAAESLNIDLPFSSPHASLYTVLTVSIALCIYSWINTYTGFWGLYYFAARHA